MTIWLKKAQQNILKDKYKLFSDVFIMIIIKNIF